MTAAADDKSQQPSVPVPPGGDASRADGPEGEASEPAVDGRRLRRDRNREAVVRSLIELVEDGHALPTAAQIAERSDVSLRSVFRYFEDRDELLEEANNMAYERYAPLAHIPNFGNGSFEDRLDAIVAQRLRLFPAITPVLRSVRLRAASGNHVLLDAVARQTQPLDEQVVVQFRPELDGLGDDRETAASSLVVLLSASTFELLTQTQRRELSEVRAVYELTVRSIVAPALP